MLLETMLFGTVEEVQQRLQEQKYLADRGLAVAVYLAAGLRKPLLLEGEAGVGKTELAKAIASSLGTKLIRLQCYEGIEASQALYEWNYPKQILRIKLEEARGTLTSLSEPDIYSEEFLVKRPLYEAISSSLDRPPVLLIDEIDRADEEFEAFLLEILSDFQITIPELGTIKAHTIPFVVITSNRTRELHDALKRRCLYYWVDYPVPEREYQIVLARVPQINQRLAAQICRFVQSLRQLDLVKKPGIAETLDWGLALTLMHKEELDEEVVRDTLSCLLKCKEDISQFESSNIRVMLAKAKETCF